MSESPDVRMWVYLVYFLELLLSLLLLGVELETKVVFEVLSVLLPDGGYDVLDHQVIDPLQVIFTFITHVIKNVSRCPVKS